MTEVLEKTQTSLTTIFPVNINQIRVDLNSRYGWDSAKIIDAYRSKIEELKDSIASEGFKPSKPVEVYDTGEKTEDGLIIYGLEDGHRRYQSSVELYGVNQNLPFGSGLQPGEIWAVLVEKPTSVLARIRSQLASNRTQQNTKMDIAKAISLAFDELQAKKSAKSNNLKAIGDALGMSRANAILYLEMFSLPDPIKDWIQESELNPDKLDVTLGFSMASIILQDFKLKEDKKNPDILRDVNAILLSALAEAESNPGDVKTIGKAITKEYLYSLAKDLKITNSKIEQKKDTTTSVKLTTSEHTSDKVVAHADIHPHTPTTSEKQYKDDFDFGGDVDKTLDKALERGENPPKPVLKPGSKNTSNSVPKTDSKSIENIKTQLLKLLLSPEVGACFVDGRADVSTSTFYVEIPMNKGIELSELLQSALDPQSNPIIVKSETDILDSLGELTGF